ncbi:MAG: Hint domain-containing protein [Rhodobacteraceae bacterium]|jgi:hypothetical protein|nr:Hint domain-containing protein [Paracoccaceae bacterium]
MMVYGVAQAGSANAVAIGGASRMPFRPRGQDARPAAEATGVLSASRFPLSGLPAAMHVETGVGPLAATEITAGMRVRSLSGGWQVVRAAVTVQHDLARGDATPVLMRGRALGPGPGRDVTLPAGQQIVVDSPRAEQVAAARRVAVPAAHLGHLDGIRPLAPSSAVFVHLLLDGVDAVLADGLWVQSFHPCAASLAALGAAGCRAMLLAAPRLVHRAGQAQYVAPWPVLSAREAEEVI